MDTLTNRSFSLDEDRSFFYDLDKFTRSETSRPALEIIDSSLPYEKLYDSIDDNESGNNQGRRNTNRAWRYVSKLFSLKRAGGGDSSDTRRRSAGTVTVRPSSWRPDPNRRWPVQGW
ncbi:hypothetical protein R6Q57_005577 [Mikania cordata]